MFRQSPSRNQRSKGIKLKSSLQICLLLAVCFWLIYQVKHSHDKKKEFDENNLLKKSGDVVLKFGRKDLLPQEEETRTNIEKHEEEETEEEDTGGEEEHIKHEEEDKVGEEEHNKHEEEDTGGEDEHNKHDEEEEDAGGEEEHNKHEEEEEDTGGEEENKHEEDEREEDGKTEEKEDEGRGDGDDEIDEHEIEKSGTEGDNAEAFVDEEAREGENGKESEKDEENKEGHSEDENPSEDHNHDGGVKNAQETREEPYKADDASSAVTHDAQSITTETEKGNSENPNENTKSEIIEQDNKANNTEETVLGQNSIELTVGDREMAETATNSEENVIKIVSSKSEDASPLNSTITAESKDQLEVSNNPSEANTEIRDSLPQNGTENISSSTQAQLDSNSTATMQIGNTEQIMGQPLNSSIVSESVIQQQDVSSDASANTEDSLGTSGKEENIETTEDEKSDTNRETDGMNDGGDEALHDHIDSLDSSNHLQEKDVRTDLETLPEIQTEGTANEDTAAE